jgi:lipoic acid synthetase
VCPNQCECFGRETVTFMILGKVCTRRCRFCAVEKGTPAPVDAEEPERVATAAEKLKLRHVVVTSVTRDDLADGGASQFARTVEEIARRASSTVEVLTPDFKGDERAIRVVADAGPDVYNHNLESVPSLYETVRPGADYERSLRLLKLVKGHGGCRFTKSGVMLGLGESIDEVLGVMRDLRGAGCDLLTLGQYLAPSKEHLPVARFVHPDEFEELAAKAREMGFSGVSSGPFVRSSHMAGELFEGAKDRQTSA